MNKAQKYLLENNLDDIVLNEKEYPENNIFNAEKWIYLSDILEQYLAENQGQLLPIDSVVGRSEQLCDHPTNKRASFKSHGKDFCWKCGKHIEA